MFSFIRRFFPTRKDKYFICVKQTLEAMQKLQEEAYMRKPELTTVDQKKGLVGYKLLSDSEISHFKIDHSDVIEDIVVEYKPRLDIDKNIVETTYQVKIQPYDKHKIYTPRRS